MAEQTTSSIEINASPEQVMQVIADFAAYPQWAQGVKSAVVVEPGDQGRARQVAFELEQKPISDAYTLSYVWNGDESVTWTLVEGKTLKALDGSYELQAVPAGTRVTYKLSVDISIPMIGMLRRKAEKVIIDSALKGLKKRVESIS
ncbi:MAG TPA: SRPBCC family protein [Marmoricola sp.]|nr:SRPBCC family protein [Marmoricola sp.]HNI71387.1 SRPBCC family protein [Marmoricola sp.]HNJ78335.1 SRPBCC family protein [Marmoricola sp.]